MVAEAVVVAQDVKRTGASLYNQLVGGQCSTDLRHQLAPGHAAGVADDINARYAAALDHVVGAAALVDAAHQAHVITQLAAQADALIAEIVKETQEAVLQGAAEAAAAAQSRDAVDR